MKQRAVYMIFIILALLAGYVIGTSRQPRNDDQPADAPAADAESRRHVDLTIRYQSALTEANLVIEQLNDDVAAAQSIEPLEELEAYVDAIPLRDTIAHPQMD